MMIKDDENALKTTKVKRDETNFVQLMYAMRTEIDSN